MRLWLPTLCLLAVLPCAAQRDFLTAAEVDQLREIQEPNARLPLYIGFAKQRVALIQQLIAKEKTGRSGMIHDVLDEYSKIIEAIDAVTDDALSRRLPVDTGEKAVVEGEKQFLAAFNKISASPPKDYELYKFALEQAVLATQDSLEMAGGDLKTRAQEVQARDAKEKKEREAAMRPEEVETRRATEQKETEQKKKVPTLRRPGETAEPKP